MSAEQRFIDFLLASAQEINLAAGLNERSAEVWAAELVRRIQEQKGGERHYVHGISARERARLMVNDPRPPRDVAKDFGVSIVTVYRARYRRIVPGGTD